MHKQRLLLGLGVVLLVVGVVPFAVRQLSSVRGATSRGRDAATRHVAYASTRPSNTLDRVADLVFGQADFTSNGVAIAPNANSLNNPGGIVVDVATGRIFIADTGNNRVLSWPSVDTYQNGQPADVVLGQPTADMGLALPATAMTLNAPTGVAVGADGALLVADTGNNRVLQFAPPFTTGMAATKVIGQADFTSTAAPTPPSATSLHSPVGITFDLRGNLVVADRDNNRVLGYEPPFDTGMAAYIVVGQPRKAHDALNFESSGAADPPTAVSLNHPSGVAVSILGNHLYVADTGNNRVVVYDQDPDIIVDEAIAKHVLGQPDFGTNRIGATVTATTLNAPRGVALDDGDRLYVADSGNNRVLEYDDPIASTAANSVFGQNDMLTTAGAANPPNASSLKAPEAVVADGVMGLYIADSGNNRALEYDQPLPNTLPRIDRPVPATIRVGHAALTLAVQGVGFLSTTQVLINGVLRTSKFVSESEVDVQLATGDVAQPGRLTVQVRTPAPGGGTSNPASVTVYVPAAGDTVADRVLGQSDFASSEGEFVPPSASTLDLPTCVTVDQRTGRLFVCDTSNFRVLSWPNAASFADGQAADLVVGQADFEHNEFASPERGGSQRTASNMYAPYGVAVDAQGNLYVSDAFNNRVLLYAAPLKNGIAATRVIGQADFTHGDAADPPTASSLKFPERLSLAVDGTLYVADSGNNRVLAFPHPWTGPAVANRVFGQHGDFATNTINTGGLTAESLNLPIAVQVGPDGTLYVSDNGNNRVLAYRDPRNSTGSADRVYGQPDFVHNDALPPGPDTLYGPFGVAIDQTGTLLVADAGNHRVVGYRRAASNRVADIVFGQAGSLTSNARDLGGVNRESLNSPNGLAVDASGNVLIADFNTSRLLGFDHPVVVGPTSLFLPLVGR